MIETVTLRGRAYLARSSQETPAELIVAPDVATLRSNVRTVLAECPSNQLKIDAPLARTDRRIRMPDGSLFETADNDGVKRLTGSTFGAHLSSAERFGTRLVLVVIAAAIGVAAIWAYALPALVWIAVALTPEPLRDAIDAGTLQAADATIAEESGLSSARQAEIQGIFQRLVELLPEERARDFTLEFRSIPDLGPNAVALPGGTIVLTDDLAVMFPEDDVIAGVLGHELGHVVEDHGLTQLYRSLGVFVLVALIAGDTGPVLEEILLEGGVLASLSFSRVHEEDADQFGLALSDRAGFDPSGLLRFFEALPDAEETEANWLSTHPSSGARIEAIEEYLENRYN